MNQLNTRLKRTVAAVTAVSILASQPVIADVNSSMQSWFNDMGAYGNVSGPASYKAQTMNFYTGGSMYARTPVKSYNLASIQAPGFKAGCGGIDLFGGSFSFINKEQFISLLRNIGNNAIGLAFNQALCAMTPDLCDLLKYLQDQVSKVNNMNINSCQAAEGLVTALGSTLTDKTQEKEGKVAGANTNLYGDVFESWDAWKDRTKAKQIRQQAGASDDALKDLFEGGNIVWKALQKVNGIDNSQRELMMSMVGTIVISPPGENGDEKGKWDYIAGTNVAFRQFVGDGAVTSASVAGLSCGGDADCMTPTVNSTLFTFKPFSNHVRGRLKAMSDKISNRDSTGQTAMDTGLIAMSSLPVWKMIGISAQIPGGEKIVEDYSQIVAVDIAYTYFITIAKTLRSALQKATGKGAADQAAAAEKLTVRLDEVEREARDMLRAEYAKGMQVAELSRNLQFLHQSVQSGMPTNIFQSMQTFGR